MHCSCCHGVCPPSPCSQRPGTHWKGRGLRGGPGSGEIGGWRRLPKWLRAVTVGYKCHGSWHLASGRQWLGIGWAPCRGWGTPPPPPSNASLPTPPPPVRSLTSPSPPPHPPFGPSHPPPPPPPVRSLTSPSPPHPPFGPSHPPLPPTPRSVPHIPLPPPPTPRSVPHIPLPPPRSVPHIPLPPPPHPPFGPSHPPPPPTPRSVPHIPPPPPPPVRSLTSPSPPTPRSVPHIPLPPQLHPSPPSSGCFKMTPPGTVWFGAEVPRPMGLSRMKRALCGALLRFMATFGHSAHVSFGENKIPEGMCECRAVPPPPRPLRASSCAGPSGPIPPHGCPQPTGAGPCGAAPRHMRHPHVIRGVLNESLVSYGR